MPLTQSKYVIHNLKDLKVKKIVYKSIVCISGQRMSVYRCQL